MYLSDSSSNSITLHVKLLVMMELSLLNNLQLRGPSEDLWNNSPISFWANDLNAASAEAERFLGASYGQLYFGEWQGTARVNWILDAQ